VSWWRSAIVIWEFLLITRQHTTFDGILLYASIHGQGQPRICNAVGTHQGLGKRIASYLNSICSHQNQHLKGTEYSWASSIFYFGYLVWSWPSSYLAVRLPLGKYLGVTVIIWGAVLMCHGATYNYVGLMVARFFLGVTEAAVAPGFSLITGMFYKRREQPSRLVHSYLKHMNFNANV
jgi:MFS family permease